VTAGQGPDALPPWGAVPAPKPERRIRLVRRAVSVIPVCALVGTLLLTSGGAAAAAPVTPLFTIAADRAAAVPAGHFWAFNDFFPRSATIAQGGTFQFVNGGGFHTATLLPSSWTAAADQDVNGIVAADIDDTALQAGGQLKLVEQIPAAVLDSGTEGRAI